MTRFIMLYRGPATPMEDITPELGEQLMQAWNEWIGSVGDAMVEVGTPFGGRSAVHGDGSVGSGSDLNGYSIVEADDLGAAEALCKGHPFLSDGTSAFSVEVYELIPM